MHRNKIFSYTEGKFSVVEMNDTVYFLYDQYGTLVFKKGCTLKDISKMDIEELFFKCSKKLNRKELTEIKELVDKVIDFQDNIPEKETDINWTYTDIQEVCKHMKVEISKEQILKVIALIDEEYDTTQGVPYDFVVDYIREVLDDAS